MSTSITIDSHIKDKLPGFSLGLLEYKDCTISEIPKLLKGKINLFAVGLRLEYGEAGLTQIQGVKEWRKAFKFIGIDPSKYRPSSESLLKRVLQEKPMYWINSAVDVNNYLSMLYAMPYGIYNADLIQGNIELRMGNAGENYEGLNGRETSMEGKLILADEYSPFGSPIVDSVRTSITEEATHIFQFVFIYPEYPAEKRESLLHQTATLFTHIHGGSVVRNEMVLA